MAQYDLGGFPSPSIGRLSDANLIPANIIIGKSIFGVLGTGGTWASGTFTTSSSSSTFLAVTNATVTTQAAALTVSGLSFTPKIVVAYKQGSGVASFTAYELTVALNTGEAFALGGGAPNFSLPGNIMAGILVTPTNTSSYQYNGSSQISYYYNLDGTYAYIRSGSFQIPVTGTSTTYTWYALG